MQIEILRKIQPGYDKAVFETRSLQERDRPKTEFLHQKASGKFPLIEQKFIEHGARIGDGWEVKDMLGLLALATIDDFMAKNDKVYGGNRIKTKDVNIELLVSEEFYASGKKTYSGVSFRVKGNGKMDEKEHTFIGSLFAPSGVFSPEVSGIPLSVFEYDYAKGKSVEAVSSFGYSEFLDDKKVDQMRLTDRGMDLVWHAASRLVEI